MTHKNFQASRGQLPPKTLLSVVETATVLGVSPEHVTKLIANGNLKAIEYGGQFPPVLPHFVVERALNTPGFAHKVINQLPPNAVILSLEQAIHLSDVRVDSIRTQFAHGFVFYALPGPFGPVVRSYLPTATQAEHAARQRKAAEYERERAGRTETDAEGNWI